MRLGAWTLVGVVSCAACAAGTSSRDRSSAVSHIDPSVTLDARGATPWESLRFAPVDGRAESFAVRSVHSSEGQVDEYTFEVDARPGAPVEGIWPVEFRVQVGSPPGPGETFGAMVQMNAQGVASAPEVITIPGAQRPAKRVDARVMHHWGLFLRHDLRELFVTLPHERIGVGSTWTSVQSGFYFEFAEVTRTTNYELVAFDGVRGVILAEFTQAATPNVFVDRAGKVDELVSQSTVGSGRFEFDLRRAAVATASVELHTTRVRRLSVLDENLEPSAEGEIIEDALHTRIEAGPSR